MIPVDNKPLLVVLTGKVTHFTQPKKVDGSLGATLNTDTTTVKLELAPQSYLDKIGLALKEDDAVTVTGMQKTSKKNFSLSMSVQILKLGEKTYLLRDEKNNVLWLPLWKNKKVTGTVKEIATPDAAAVGDARFSAITLVTGVNSLTVLLAPADYMAKTGLIFAVGDKVIIDGAIDTHATQGPLLATTVKLHDVLYTLREKKTRKGLWEVAAQTPLIAPPPPVTPTPAGVVPTK